MVDFKVVIGDPKAGKSYQKEVSGHHANSLLGKKITEQVDGIFVELPGYKLVITGGSDGDGRPMRGDLPGPNRRRLLVSEGIGFRPKKKGVRRRILMCGNTISPNIVQINMKVDKYGPRSIEEHMAGKEDDK